MPPKKGEYRMSDEEWTRRFISLIEHQPNDCWRWSGSIDKRSGYGKRAIRRRSDDKSVVGYVHRLAYELWIGPIPEGFEIDHLCHNADKTCPGGLCDHRLCVNPEHLEAVPTKVNRLRQRNVIEAMNRTHCLHGHERTIENLYVYTRPDGRQRRDCAECARSRERDRRKKV